MKKSHTFLQHFESFLLLQAIFSVALLTVFGFLIVSPKIDVSIQPSEEGRVAGVTISTNTELDFELRYAKRRHTATDYVLFDQNEYVIEITPKSLPEGELLVDLVGITNVGTIQEGHIQVSAQILGRAADGVNVNLISSDGYRTKLYDALEGNLPYDLVIAPDSFENLRIEYDVPTTINFPFTVKIVFKY